VSANPPFYTRSRFSLPAIFGLPRLAQPCGLSVAGRGKVSSRSKTAFNGYGFRHKALRRRWKPKVEAGLVDCARCGEQIEPGTPWDLGHRDDDRRFYSGPEHRACNRAAPPRAAWAALTAAKPETMGSTPAIERPREIIWSRHWSGGFTEACPACQELGGPCEDAKDG
jgi:hypothetical protein